MLSARTISAVLFALPLLAAATPLDARGGGSGASCSTGDIQCCESISKADSAAASKVLGLLGVVVQDVNAIVGLNCSPISVVGVGSGNACSANTVCCENNSFGGLISIGCLPVTL